MIDIRGFLFVRGTVWGPPLNPEPSRTGLETGNLGLRESPSENSMRIHVPGCRGGRLVLTFGMSALNPNYNSKPLYVYIKLPCRV